MAFRGIFIGINKHHDPGISELGGAVRDAHALYALFRDTFSDLQAEVLTDEKATLEAIRKGLKSTLSAASTDDVVVVTFAGHGTPGHQLVAYDTDRDTPGSTTLPMLELAQSFQESRARAVLCIVDACFSGAAPARVLEGLPAPRAPISDYSDFSGKGRFLLAAASPTQAAWEEPGSGHGLLTHACIEILSEASETFDVTGAVGRIIAATQKAAERIGETQTPSFVGGTEGELVLPPFKRGDTWQHFFPDTSKAQVTRDVNSLASLGIPREVVAAWDNRYADGLNDLQLEAINRHRILQGESLLVVAPTSSGKTFIGEMAAVRAAVAGQKAVFLLPYRALVNEKYEDFANLYGEVVLRVIRCSGDYTDETGLLLSGRYDIALLTFEMFLGLAVSSPQLLRRLGLVVIDETQFITDPNRGISVELILTLLRSARSRGIVPQLIALSAVIGDVNKFDEWLGCSKLVWTLRPVPLTEGVIDRSGVFQQLAPDGSESEIQLIPRAAIRQRGAKPSAQDLLVPLARQLVAQGERLLVFRNTRGPAEGCAAYLARDLNLPPADKAVSELSNHDLSTSAAKLIESLKGGTAFHNSNLNRDQRVVVEQNFRAKDGGISVLVSTTTLAAGINTPASTVILAEQEFIGEDGRPFTVAEYKNMAGRAGRLGYNETGKAIIYAQTPFERRNLFMRYVKGHPEPVTSSFTEGDLRTWIIRLLSQVQSIREDEVGLLIANTFGGFLRGQKDPTWQPQIAEQLTRTLQEFLDLGLIEKTADFISLTHLGRACGQSSLSFDSSMRLIAAVRKLDPAVLIPRRLVALVQLLPEADALWTPVRKRAQTECVRVSQAQLEFGREVISQLQNWAADQYAFWARCKRAAVLARWMAGDPIQTIETTFSVPFGGVIQQGDIQRFADGTRFYLQSASEILIALGIVAETSKDEFDLVVAELEFGLPRDMITMVRPPLALSRGECLALARQGITTIDHLATASKETLQTVFGEIRAQALTERIASLNKGPGSN